MTGDLPPAPGEGPTTGPPSSSQWGPPFPTQPPPRSWTWPALALAVVATMVAIAALVVAFTRPSELSSSVATKAPSYSPTEISAAQQQLCDTYKLVAKAVQVDTNGHDVALGRIALTNAAAMLDEAAVNPALDATYRDPARTLATAYRVATAKGSREVATDAQFQAALDDINAKDAAMKKVCGG